MRKLLLSMLVVFSLFVGNVSAYKSGDQIENIGATIPSDSTTIRFVMPQGEYPTGTKITLYAQTNVLCLSPGVDYVEPTPDKNPYKLLAEYKLTDSDIAALASGDSEFTTTLKFDPECGAIQARLVGTEEKVPGNLVEEDRPQGGSEDSTGKELTAYTHGSILDVDYTASAGVLTFTVPQGSYVQGDYVVVAKDGKAIASLTIFENIMKALVEGDYTSKILVDEIKENDVVSFFVSNIGYNEGEEIDASIELPSQGNNPSVSDPNEKDDNGPSPLVVGIGVFVVVLAAGFGYMMYDEKRKKAAK